MDEQFTFDWNKISAADIEDFEEASGGLDLYEFATAIEQGTLNQDNFFKNVRSIAAFLWICKRQTQPSMTFEDVRRMPLLQLVRDLEVVQQSAEQRAPEQPVINGSVPTPKIRT